MVEYIRPMVTIQHKNSLRKPRPYEHLTDEELHHKAQELIVELQQIAEEWERLYGSAIHLARTHKSDLRDTAKLQALRQQISSVNHKK